MDEDIEIEIDEDYSDVEIEEEEEKKKVEEKSQPVGLRPATPHAPPPDAAPTVTKPPTPRTTHNATAPPSSLAALDAPSVSPSTASSQPTTSSLPHPLPSAAASSSSSSTAASRELLPASATRTSDSPLSSTAASGPAASQLYDSRAGDMSAVHHFSSPLQLGSGSSTSSSSLSLSSTADRQQQQRTAAQLEQLVEALNADNARLLLQIKQRDAHIEQMTQQHSRDKKRLRDECEQVKHELAIAQSSKRTAMEGEGEGKEMAKMREEWEKERMAWKDRENQLLYELNRLSANPSAVPQPLPSSPSLRPAVSPRPAPLDDRSASIAELQQLLLDRESQLQQQADKLVWYAENQQLLSDSQAALDQAQARIKQLERQVHTTSPTKGRMGSATSTAAEPRSLPADVKHIKQLEKEVQQLRRRLATPAVPGDREDAAMAGMIEAVKGGEEGEVVRELRSRVKELEEEMKAREEEWERRLRVMRQEQDKIRAGFEKKVRVLQEGVKGRLAQLKGKKRPSVVGTSGGEAVAVVGGVDEVVKAMEARVEEIRERYEKRIEEMQSAAEQLQKPQHSKQHLPPASPPPPSSAGSTASRTPLRSTIRSSLRPPRSASTSRLHSPGRSQPPAQHTTATAAASGDASQPSSPRARSAATAPAGRAHQTHQPLHSHVQPFNAAGSMDSTELDGHFQQLHSLLQSSHRSDLTALASHYTQLLTTLQQHTRAQLDGMQQRLTATESERQRLADAVAQLQADVWKREREAEERGWEAERWRARPGVKEYVLLERQVRGDGGPHGEEGEGVQRGGGHG